MNDPKNGLNVTRRKGLDDVEVCGAPGLAGHGGDDVGYGHGYP